MRGEEIGENNREKGVMVKTEKEETKWREGRNKRKDEGRKEVMGKGARERRVIKKMEGKEMEGGNSEWWLTVALFLQPFPCTKKVQSVSGLKSAFGEENSPFFSRSAGPRVLI